MKNLSEHTEELTAPCVPPAGGRSPSQKKHRQRTGLAKRLLKAAYWRDKDDSLHKANLRRLTLGRLPQQMATYACADFDLEDESEYCGDDGQAASGSTLAGIAAYIVRCAKDPVDYLYAMVNVPSKVIEPIKTYLRVKLAMGRLNAEIDLCKAPLSSPSVHSCEVSVFGDQTLTLRGLSRLSGMTGVLNSKLTLSSRSSDARTGTSQGQIKANENELLTPLFSATKPCPYEVPAYAVCKQTANRDDRGIYLGTPEKTTVRQSPKFTYRTSPAKTYGFKEITAELGYDPRDTSVYWIEKRAAALRRKWKNHGRAQRSESNFFQHYKRPIGSCPISAQ